MKPDPIVAEIRKIRDAFAREQGYDVGRIVAALRASAAARKEAKRAGGRIADASKRKRRAA